MPRYLFVRRISDNVSLEKKSASFISPPKCLSEALYTNEGSKILHINFSDKMAHLNSVDTDQTVPKYDHCLHCLPFCSDTYITNLGTKKIMYHENIPV